MTTAPDELTIRRALSTVIDPEVGLDVLTMGLIYSVTANGNNLDVLMTLTTEGCPMSAYLRGAVREALEGVEGVNEVDVTITFDPHWDPSMIDYTVLDSLA